MEIFIVLALVLVMAQLMGMALGKRLKNETYSVAVSILAPPVIFGLLTGFSLWLVFRDAREFGKAIAAIFSVITLSVGCAASLLIAVFTCIIKAYTRKKE